MTSNVRIRDARADDAAPLAALAERTFRDAFAADNTAADMELHCARSYGAADQAAEIDDADTQTLVVEEGGRLVAYAQLHRGAPPPCVAVPGDGPQRVIELRRFYLLAALHGSGL